MKPETKREVLIARQAVEETIEALWPSLKLGRLPAPWEGSDSLGARLYPLPKVTRPRVVKDKWGVRWRVAPDSSALTQIHLEWRGDEGAWRKSLSDLLVTPERVTVWADLLANPTEEVEE